jgi:hypothetical protein
MNTTTNQISKTTKVRAGFYQGTLTVNGRTFRYEIERGETGYNCADYDNNFWRFGVDGKSSGYDYSTKAEAIAALHAGEWYIDTTYGLCQR